jgi:ribonuclease-3
VETAYPAPQCAEIAGYRFARPELLEEALTHASLSGGGHRARDYERMEFLGDRVLGLVIARMLLERYPSEKVGVLARRHAALVRRDALARVARQVDLPARIRLSPAEEAQRENPAVLADCCEAVVAALFLDGGLPAAQRFILEQWSAMIESPGVSLKDAKTALQEWAQGAGLPLPVYATTERIGPHHDPQFTVTVEVPGYPAASASGRSKRAAEQNAAQRMLAVIAIQASPR